MSARLVEAEQLTLVIPAEGRGLQLLEARHGHLGRLTAVEDRLDDVRGEEGEGQRAGDMAMVETALASECAQGGELSREEPPGPVPGIVDRLPPVTPVSGWEPRKINKLRF